MPTLSKIRLVYRPDFLDIGSPTREGATKKALCAGSECWLCVLALCARSKCLISTTILLRAIVVRLL
jgi:hypothetical protein